MSDGNSPNLAGQYPEVVIKQLYDYKRGDRASAFMQTIAKTLTDREIQDVAAYYDSLPKARAAPVQADEPGAPALVRVGDPLRNIVPCVACHGGIDQGDKADPQAFHRLLFILAASLEHSLRRHNGMGDFDQSALLIHRRLAHQDIGLLFA